MKSRLHSSRQERLATELADSTDKKSVHGKIEINKH
jgi:hypothetical protein